MNTMGRGKHVAKLAVGLLLSVLTIWNLYIGFYQMGSGEMNKLVLTMVFSGVCSESAIQADLNSVGISECLHPLGTWEPVDVIILSLGLLLTWRALRSLFSTARRPSRSERQGKSLQRLGMLVALVGTADLFGMLTENCKPLDASELFGFSFHNGVSHVMITLSLIHN